MSDEKQSKLREVVQRGLTTKQAAEYIGLARKTLDNYRSLETGPHYWTSDRGIIYDPVDLDKYLEKTMFKVETTYYAAESLIISLCRGDLSDVDVSTYQCIFRLHWNVLVPIAPVTFYC